MARAAQSKPGKGRFCSGAFCIGRRPNLPTSPVRAGQSLVTAPRDPDDHGHLQSLRRGVQEPLLVLLNAALDFARWSNAVGGVIAPAARSRTFQKGNAARPVFFQVLRKDIRLRLPSMRCPEYIAQLAETYRSANRHLHGRSQGG